MLCPNCGGPADDTASFCPSCGSDLNAEHVASQTAYQAQVAQYERDMAAYQSQYGTAASAPDATPGAAPIPAQQPASSNRNGCIIAGCVVALFLCVIVSCGTWFLGTTVFAAIPFFSAITQMPDGTRSGEGLDTTSPQATVDAWYVAVADGDLAAAKKLSTADFGATIDKDQFNGPQDFDHTITSTITRNDSATVIVKQTSPDVSGTVILTFKLAKQSDGDWLITAVDVTANDPTSESSLVAVPAG